MASKQVDTTFFGELSRELRQLWQTIAFGLSSAGAGFRNQIRRLRHVKTDYIVIPLSGSLPERAAPPRGFLQRRLPLPSPPLSMEQLNHQLQLIADAGNVKGVIFVFQGFSAGLATLQNLRRAIQRLGEAGKETVVFSPYLDLPHYFAASAAGRIVVPPPARFEVVGMRTEAVFLKDALGRIGIEADVIQISPFKTAYNEFGESDITPEQEQQLNWILDDAYDQVTSAMAEGRRLQAPEMRALIDQAPMSAEAALAAGLIDHVAYEDTLPALLGDPAPQRSAVDSTASTGEHPQTGSATGGQNARLSTYAEAQSILMEKPRRPTRQYIAVVSLEGSIAMGASRSAPLPIPLLSGEVSGESTLSRQLRRAEKDPRIAALIIHIDSGGGSALASDLIWRQLDRIASHVPVIAYLGNVAASGGYYVAAAGHHIISQSLTITGSIGVVTLHVSTQGLFEQLSVKRVALKRGERADLHSDLAPLSDENRQLIWADVTDTYERFKGIVADGRDLPLAELDEICEGRVWTGRQALERRLVDGYGDFQDTIVKAAELAGLSIDDQREIAVYNLHPRAGSHVLPKPFEEPAELLKALSRERLIEHLDRPLLIMPVEITLR